MSAPDLTALIQRLREWKRTLKVGDVVFFGYTNGGRNTLALPVTRITATQVVCENRHHTRRFMLGSLAVVGHRLVGARPFDDEVKQRIAAGHLPPLMEE